MEIWSIFFPLLQTASLVYGARWLYYDSLVKIPRESNSIPVRVKSSHFNLTSIYDVGPHFTVFGPSFQPHHRGGKILNLTLTSAQTQGRIINNPDLYRDRNEIPVDDGYSQSWRPKVTEAPVRKGEDREECICVPYYLCKDGYFVHSGGLTVANTLEGRSLSSFPKTENVTDAHFGTPGYVIQLVAATPQQSCGEQDECCRILPHNVEYNPQGVDYPVATPLPEKAVPQQPFYPPPNNRRPECGLQNAYGIYGRVQNLLYQTDISEFGEYPWQAAILKKAQGDQSLYLCGGTLISPQWVATAAHCLKNARLPKLQIRLGEWDVHRRDEIYQHVDIDVASAVIHPEFAPQTLQNDLALIRLRDPVDHFPHITPVCLPHPRQSFVGQRCWVSGWGKDSFGPQGEYQSVLKEVDIPILSPVLCEMNLRKTQLGPQFRLFPGFLCAGGEPGKDACTGDGGSPLVCNSQGQWYVAGLVSWGIGCGQPGIPGVYVNMGYYRDWINSIILR